MLTARSDQRVLGYLGRALSLELSAVQLYRTQARLADTWGLSEVAERFRAESIEELGHADRLIERMLALGVAPNASMLRPVALGQSLLELLVVDQAFELELVRLYRDAVQHCARAACHDDRMLFEGLLREEEAHYQELLRWQQELAGEAVSRSAQRGLPV